MDIFIVDWIIRDVDDRQCEVFGIGKDAEGACVAVRCPFSPHFYVEIPPSKNKTMPGRKAFALHLKEETWSGSWFEDQVTTTLVEKKPFVGYRGGSTHHLVLCKFRTLRTFFSARKRAISVCMESIYLPHSITLIGLRHRPVSRSPSANKPCPSVQRNLYSVQHRRF